MTNLSPLTDDSESSVILPSPLKEELLAPASIVVSPVEMGKSLASNVTGRALKFVEIMPGTYATCVMIKPSDIKSLEMVMVPSKLKEMPLVNASNSSGPYYMAQNLVSDITRP